MPADLLRTDMICESFVPDKQYRELRNMARTRLGVVRTRTEYKNKIHAILAKYEHKSPAYKTFSKKVIAWLRQITLTQADKITMNAYFDWMELIQMHQSVFEFFFSFMSHSPKIKKEIWAYFCPLLACNSYCLWRSDVSCI
ncbi:MAG: hypothetical protein ACREBI_12315, partial [Nitrosotalea sp.]